MRRLTPTRVFVRVDPLAVPGCWTWTGTKDHTGYGRIRFEGRRFAAHRLIYEWFVGPIPDGLTLDHLCRNRACVRPSHLEPVTLRENILRGDNAAARHARQTHCLRGHSFATHGYVYRGRRYCRLCDCIRSKASRERAKAAS